ncbi:MAG: hypothetical protein GVY17_03770 [Cyanobacteria bacterium]|jgi:hypothetical protein|nr:hypothetical protein [Cyanobacteria bacterium GSL.Bin21]
MLHWTPFQPVPNAEQLTQALADLPSHWSLTPLWEKRPYREGWQNEAFIPHQEIAKILNQGENRISKRTGNPYHAFCSGYGLRLGDVSGGLLALDIDGSSAEQLLTILAETSLPETVSWTSGKSGRRQLLYQVPVSYQEKLQSFRRKTITQWGDLTTTPGELLEFRYNQHQSVLPPSFHRETGHYRWLVPPQEKAVAIAPAWLCEFLINQHQPKPPKSHPVMTSQIRALPKEIKGNPALSSLLEEATSRLSPAQIYNWSGHHFQQFGETWRGCCPRHQSQSGRAFSLNPHTGEWYCFGCEVGGGAVQYRHFLRGGDGIPRGKAFRSLVEELAAEAGLDNQSSSQPHQTYQATHLINQQYFDWKTPEAGTLLAVKSSLGSGKTTWLGKVVSELQDEGWLALGHRNSLLLQSCQRWGFIHLQTEQAFDLIAVPHSQLALCVDSLHHFSPDAFAGKNIIIDEAIAVVTHLLMGETLKQKREEIIQRFSQALQQAKRIFCLDGMLTDWCVDYLHRLAGQNRTLVKVENRHQGEPFTVKFLQASRDAQGKGKSSDRSPLLEQLAEEGSKPVICTDSQLEAEALDQVLSQTGKQGIRIDSKTIASPDIQSFLKDPNYFITTHCPDYLIYTPAAEAGVDISIRNYFTDQFCLFFGILQTNAQLQMMSRVRDPKLKRWLWCSRYGQVKNHAPSFQFPEALMQAMQSFILQTGSTLLEGKETTEAVEQFMQKVTKVTQESHYQTFCILKAIQNYEQSHLWDCLYQALVNRGQNVELVTLESCPAAQKQEKTAKETVKLTNAEAIYWGKDQHGKQAETTHKLLKKQLPGIEKTAVWSPQFIKRILYDDRAFITKQERFWLIHHPEIAQQMMQSVWYSAIEQHLIREMHQQWSLIQGLITLDLPHLLKLEKTWTHHSQELQQLSRQIQASPLTAQLKLQANASQPIPLFRQLLQLIGVKLMRKQGRYQINPTVWYERDRLAILACLDRRFLHQPTSVSAALY